MDPADTLGVVLRALVPSRSWWTAQLVCRAWYVECGGAFVAPAVSDDRLAFRDHHLPGRAPTPDGWHRVDDLRIKAAPMFAAVRRLHLDPSTVFPVKGASAYDALRVLGASAGRFRVDLCMHFDTPTNCIAPLVAAARPIGLVFSPLATDIGVAREILRALPADLSELEVNGRLLLGDPTPELSRFTRLKTLSVIDCRGCHELSAALRRMPLLETAKFLDCGGCAAEWVAALADACRRLQELTTNGLSRMDREEFGSLARVVGRLRKLRLMNAGRLDSEFSALPVSKLEQLELLDGQPGAQAVGVFEMVGRCASLRQLSLTRMHVGDDPMDLFDLSAALPRFLQRLALRSNRVGENVKDVELLLAGLDELPNLEELDLGDNALGKTVYLTDLVPRLARLPRLERLRLDSNALGGMVPLRPGELVPVARGSPLRHLDLASNHLGTGDGDVDRLAVLVGALDGLETLAIGYNVLDGVARERIRAAMPPHDRPVSGIVGGLIY
jgi:hypothetical protein